MSEPGRRPAVHLCAFQLKCNGLQGAVVRPSAEEHFLLTWTVQISAGSGSGAGTDPSATRGRRPSACRLQMGSASAAAADVWDSGEVSHGFRPP